jgi:Cdc6-like AAA superfamily ATPase
MKNKANLPKITPQELSNMLRILDNMDNPPALMVYGPPGIGKTSILKEFAESKNYELRVKHFPEWIPPTGPEYPRWIKIKNIRSFFLFLFLKKATEK